MLTQIFVVGGRRPGDAPSVALIATIHPPMSRPSPLTTPVGRFADRLLTRDLPQLEAHRRADTVAFIQERVDGLASFTRFGVIVISQLVDLLGRIVGASRALDVAVRIPLPLLSEYPRLIRSLGYTYVWEKWPSTAVDGSAP